MAVSRDAQGRFVASIGVEDKASPAFNKISKNSQNVIKAFKAVGNANVRLNQTFELIGRAQRAMQQVVGATVGEFAKFETAMVGVGKTANLSDADLSALGTQFQRLSETIPTTANELAALGQTAGQLGVTGNANLLKFSKTMAELSTASDLAGEAGATALARILNITDGGVQNIDKFASAIVGLGNRFAATESEIAKVATDVARSTSVFELGAANVAGISTAIKAMGIQAQLGGSVIGKAFRTIDDAIRSGGQELEILQQITGKTAAQLRKSFKEDATGVFQSFVEGLGRVQASGGSVSQTLSLLKLEGDEVNKVLPVMAQRADLVGRALEVANTEFEKNTALAEEARKANQTLSAEWKKLQNVITNAAVDISSVLAPAIKEMVVLLKKVLIGAIEDVKKVWKDLTDTFRDMGGLKSVINDLAGEFEFFGIALAAAISPALAAGLTAITTFVIATVGPAALLAVNFAGIAAAILTVAAAGDILIRNMGKWDKVAVLFGAVFIKAINSIAIAFDKLVLSALQGIQRMILASKDFAQFMGVGVGDSLLKVGGAIDFMIGRVADLEGEGETINGFIAQAAEGLDLGFAGKVFEVGSKFLDKFNKKLGETADLAKKAGKETDKVKPPAEGGGDIAALSNVKFPQLFNPDDIAMIGATLGEASAGIASGASALAATPLAFLAVADMILDAILEIINIIPKLLNKIADVFNNLTDLPGKLAEGLANVMDSIINAITNFLPNIVNMVGEIFVKLGEFLAEGLPDAITGLADSIPEVLIKLIEQLPKIAGNFGKALLKLNPAVLAIRFMLALVKQVPKLVTAIIKAIPAIVNEFVMGFINALKSFANEISNALGLGDIFNIGQIEDGIMAMGDTISRAASNMFEVIDLEAQARGLDVADRIRAAIGGATSSLRDLWAAMMNALRRAWEWVRDTILMPIFNALKTAWLWVYDNIIEPIITVVQKAWQWVIDNIITPLGKAVSAAFQWVVDKVLTPLAGAVTAAFQWVIDKVITPLAGAVSKAFKWVVDNVLTPLSTAGATAFAWVKKNIVDKFVGEDNVFKTAFAGIKSFLDGFGFPEIKTPGWLQSFIDAIAKLTSWGPKFSSGGLVGTGGGNVTVGTGAASASVGKDGVNVGGSGGVTISTSGTSVGGVDLFSQGGMAGGRGNPVTDINAYRKAAASHGVKYLASGGPMSKGTDTLPAMLTPGEFVINRESTRRNMGLLSFINNNKNGSVAPVQGNTTVSVIVNAKTDLSPDQIRREIIPEMKKQLRRASQDGAFVIDKRGIRS